MSAARMRTLVGGRVYWARRQGFLYPGLIVWARGRHWRVLPIPATRWARRCRPGSGGLR